ncbi:HAMP domain-containing methyl-accepting chemotaxis protein [Gloeocapsa sp. PCC 73106]|uniref:methyl-accepting chemotaxis protein n=1 Tax=Gloeocapsa sp. PCC 73106 TaxID=102232 RepID=UPI0002AC0471|nr:HAMP domain-containing methyl-accepting chemotaxis protein [Gloeocapsa sp. PCC 73106]ELR96381.1 methyl-accepting chemotaxis protein [Gloeocapsa sp. PCC 73106]
MTSGVNYSEAYAKAEKAYLNGNYQEAAGVIDEMAREFPEDPSVLLLRGHIYCYGLQQYEMAKQQYQLVLELTDKTEFVNFAHDGLVRIRQMLEDSEPTQSTMGLKSSFTRNQAISDLDGDFEERVTAVDEQTAYQQSRFSQAFGLKSDNNLYSKGKQVRENPFEDEEDEVATEHHWQETIDRSSRTGEFPFFEPELVPDVQDNLEVLDREEAPTFVVSSALEEMSYFEDIFDEHGSGRDNDYSSELDPIDDSMATSALKGGDSDDISEDLSAGEDNRFSDFEADLSQELPDSGLFDDSLEEDEGTINFDLETINRTEIPNRVNLKDSKKKLVTNFVGTGDNLSKPKGEIKLGPLAVFFNAPIRNKQLVKASLVGILSAIAVMGTGIVTTNTEAGNSKFFPLTKPGALITLVAGLTGFSTSLLIGELLTREIKRYKQDLLYQFNSICQGDLSAKATVYSEDELGEIASGFNQMIRVINTTTSEAQRRAEETERDREDLQRQVIRLLDDVEGAARGDLTVKAQVNADVLGAVADAFNLTIENLREIVRQVKQASQQVHQGTTHSESFARNQSSDALRMATELAATLNSVQMLTESIQRVAESAREAESVARSSAVTAVKGGEAVETTVAGILQIRETVSETTRKVKRLAEASQEISKIVALIGTISSRTNLLALNASIQAEKAGEAGRGFAIVAHEVRQLADRSAKSLTQIEQIVLQIQSETGSVMTAMEEGLQQVFDVTEKAEQAKGALDDIIHVSNRIDVLVRSISADTVEQRENSRAVAQVMQSVELTAQETSKESQKVADSLQNLVSIARDLLSSVERFRVDSNEKA